MIKKIIFILFVFAYICNVNAAVRAIGGDGEASGQVGLTPSVKFTQPNTSQLCSQAGFNKTSCPANQNAVFPCPYNSNYFKDCCPKDYKYSATFCYENGLEPSSNSCYDFYACLPKKDKK